jgi:hypothetical protein
LECVYQTVFAGSYDALVKDREEAVGSFQISSGIEQAVTCQIIGTQFAELACTLALFMKDGTTGFVPQFIAGS